MRYTLKTLTVVFAFIIQNTVCDYIKVMGIAPNILLSVVVIIALSSSMAEAGAFGLLAGVLVDLFWGKVFGINALLFMYLALSVRGFLELVYKNSPVVTAGITFVATLLYEVVYYVLSYVIWGEGVFTYAIFRLIVPTAAYTSIAQLIIYGPITAISSINTERGSRL